MRIAPCVLCVFTLLGCGHAGKSSVATLPWVNTHYEQRGLPWTHQSEAESLQVQVPGPVIFGQLNDMVTKMGNPADGDYVLTWKSEIQAVPPARPWVTSWKVELAGNPKTLTFRVTSIGSHAFIVQETYANTPTSLIAKLAHANAELAELKRNGCSISRSVVGHPPLATPSLIQ